MRQTKVYTRTVASKGDRLHWISLKDVKHVRLSNSLTKGRMLKPDDLSKIKNTNSTPNVLIP